MVIFKTPTQTVERLASAIGGLVAIVALFIVSDWSLGMNDAPLVVGSMAASSVLLFAIPHGQLSQPWAVFGGHMVSAIIGVSCAQLITNDLLAVSVAVGLAIGLMYYLKCIHPPGGATAFVAVMGGDKIHELGYQFVLTPILLNVLVILLVALLFNALFSWRRYPLALFRKSQHVDNSLRSKITHADFVYALSQADSFMEVSEFDLVRIYDLATQNAKTRQFDEDKIKLDSYYRNGAYGAEWSVRYIVDESPHEDSDKHSVIYKTVAGFKRRTSAVCNKQEFALWAKYEVHRDEDNWKRVTDL